MHDDPRLTSFMESVCDAFSASTAPAPGEELRSLFATGMEIPVAPTTTTRRPRMFSDMFKAVPGKVAAGLLGATLAYSGLGAAGALPGALSLASSDDETEQAAVVDDTTTTTVDDDTTTTTVADGDDDGDQADGEGKGKSKGGDVDLATVPIPTSVSEAAHNHAFDEACENHGKYVSHFARFGTEPECATTARSEAAEGAAGQSDEAVTADDADDSADDGKGKPGKGKAKAKANKGKGKKARS